MLWGHPGRPWEAHGPSRGALGAALGRPREPWGALGVFQGQQNGTWTPLGSPGHPQGPSRMDFPWIFDGIGADNDTLGKGKVATMPLPQGACHNAQAPRNWQRYLLQLRNCGDVTATGKLPWRGLERSAARLARRFGFILRFAATMFVAFATGNAEQATILF